METREILLKADNMETREILLKADKVSVVFERTADDPFRHGPALQAKQNAFHRRRWVNYEKVTI